MRISIESLGLSVDRNIDRNEYVLFCTKVNRSNPNDCIYIVPRKLYENADDEDCIPLCYTNVENNVVKLILDKAGNAEFHAYTARQKSDLVEITF